MKAEIRPYSVALHVALLALCVVVVLLARENLRLKERLAPPPVGPEIGQVVEPVRWLPLDGKETTLDLTAGSRESLLLVFTTDCPACKENQSAWRELHRRTGDSADVVGISLSGLEATCDYRDALDLPFPVGVPAEPGAFIAALAVTGVPMTIRVGADGRVLGSWSGTLSDHQLSEVFRADRG